MLMVDIRVFKRFPSRSKAEQRLGIFIIGRERCVCPVVTIAAPSGQHDWPNGLDMVNAD